MIKKFVYLFLFLSFAVNGQQTINKLITKELTVQDKVEVTSTTKSSKPCPVMTEVQRDAISSPATGSCVYNSTSLQLNVYDGVDWQEAGGGGISLWETALAYEENDVVIESDKIYRCIVAHTSGTFATDLSNGNWTEVSGTPYESTGLISGGILSIDTDTTKFDATSYLLAFTGNVNPIICPALDAQTIANIATADTTYLLADDTCAITQQTTFPTPQEQRAKAFIGRVNHPNRTTIQSTYNSPNYAISTNSQFYDLIDSIGPFNKSGNVISPNGANLSINRSAGVIFRRGSNYATDSNNPHEKSFSSATIANLFRSTQNAIGTTLFTTLDVTNYDNAGTVTAIGGVGGRSTNQRVYLLASGNLAVQYGQVIYNNLGNAVAGIPNESFTPNQNITESGVLIGVISCRRDATDASNPNQCVFSKVSRFDSSGVSVGSNAATTLQVAYNNSEQPQITTDTSGLGVQFKRGSLNDTDVVVEVLNGAGTSKFSVTGEGAVSAGSTITATGNITGANLAGTNTGNSTVDAASGYIGGAGMQVVEVPNAQVTSINLANKKVRFEFGNNNELINPNLEAETVTEGWTVSNATSSSSTTRIEGSKSLSLALTGALSLSQSSTINAAQKSGVQMVASIWVNSSDVSDLQLCSLKNGAEDKCTVTGGYVQGSGWRQLTVSFLGNSTSNGLKLKSTDTTGTVLVDQAYVGIGSPVVDFTPDSNYWMETSGRTTIAKTNVSGWVTAAGAGSSGVSAVTFGAGTFTAPPSCGCEVINGSDGSDRTCQIVSGSVTISGVSVLLSGNGSSNNTYDYKLTCGKTGADYKTSKAYVASGSLALNTTEYSAKLSSSGVVSDENADFLTTCTNANPMVCTFVSGKFTVTPNCTAHLQSTSSTIVPISAISTTSVSITMYDTVPRGTLTLAPVVLSCQKAGADYQSAFNPVIVGSFQGYNETPGTSRVETFSVSYGTTNATTVCSASPCSYLDQIGNAVTSVTRASSGNYTVNFSKTYSKVKCTPNFASPSYTQVGAQNSALVCNGSCTAIAFVTGAQGTGTVDSYGTIMCQGIPQ